jgi:predicted  nucleic acid-binding Zn-ribbon protein
MDSNVLRRLLVLQEADMRLRDMETRLTTLPKEMNNIIAKRDKINESTAAAVAAVKKIKLRIKQDEDLIAELESGIEKMRQQSSMVKKNNEYQAMLAAIELNKKKIGEAEERILIAADELEEAKKSGARIKFANDAEIKNLKAEFDELFNFSKVVKEEIAKLQAARPELVRDIPPALLSPYESLRNNKEGAAPLTTAPNETCGHCRLKITAQTAVALKRGEIAYCDNCQYLLYDPESLC